jgi:short subunit dehydrogenase-like uncharacterized protein
MAPKEHGRQYGIVLLGATGYTGGLTAEYIVQHLPTNLQWAIAGRSREKLENLAVRLKKLALDRVPPGKNISFLLKMYRSNLIIRMQRLR